MSGGNQNTPRHIDPHTKTHSLTPTVLSNKLCRNTAICSFKLYCYIRNWPFYDHFTVSSNLLLYYVCNSLKGSEKTLVFAVLLNHNIHLSFLLVHQHLNWWKLLQRHTLTQSKPTSVCVRTLVEHLNCFELQKSPILCYLKIFKNLTHMLGHIWRQSQIYTQRRWHDDDEVSLLLI